MIGTIDVEVQALNPNMPLYPMRAYVGSPSSIRIRNVPKRIGKWCIDAVYFTVVYPDSSIKTAQCVLTGGVWTGTVEGTVTSGISENGYTIFADGTDENGNPVTGYILGRGDVKILEADGTIVPDPTRYYVHLLSAQSSTPAEGDMYPTDDGYVIWQNGQANQLGTPFDQISAYVESAVSAKADLSAIPSNTSQLSNDSGFVTSSEMETSLELKQDKLSADQTYVIDREVWDLYTHIQTAGGAGQYDFKSPSTFDKSVLIEQGILSSDGTTWIYPPIRVTMGTNVTWINNGAFQNATSLLSFIGKNVSTFQGNIFNGCNALNYVNIPNVAVIGLQMFRYCTALKTLTLPQSLKTVNRSAFIDSSFDQVYFEGKTLAQVKAMTNYDRWGLAEDKIYTNAFENQLPTKTSELSNDSGYITSAQVPTPAYIEGANGNKIEADLDCYVEDLYVPWTVNGIQLIFTGTSSSQDWTGDNGEYKYELIGAQGTTAYEWTLTYFMADGTGWEFMGEDVTQADIDATEIEFTALGVTATRNVLVQDKLALKSDLPTKTSQLSNDSGFVEQNNTAVLHDLTCDSLVANQAYIVGYAMESDLSAKRDLTDMKVKGVPEKDNSASWFTIKYETTTENARYYDEGRWETGQTLRVLAEPAAIFSLRKQIEGQWTDVGEFQLDSNAEATITYEGVTYLITGYIGDLVVSNELNTRLSALEARIAALEGN